MESRRSFTLPILVLAFTPALLAANFEGKWVLDNKKTQAVGAPERFEMEIDQDGSQIKITSKFKEPKSSIYPLLWVGILTNELELTTDGSEKVTQIGPFAHNSKTRLEGNTMTTDFVASNDTGKVEGQWVRKLSGDGKEMTFQVISKSSDGRTLDQTMVLKRK
jgi:hypothetical protein